MPSNTYDQYTDDTSYIVGRPFQTTQGWCWPGEPASEEVVSSGNLYALISAGFVYPYVPDKGYAYLPPHVFNAVRTYQEVNDIIKLGEAPIEMEWTPPKKLEEAQAVVDAESASKAANVVVSQVQAEDWTRKLEVSQISPRPIELPREELFTDAKKGEAEEAGESEEGEEEGTDERVAAAEAVFAELEPTPVYTAGEDDPLKPEFEDGELQQQYEEAQEATVPSDHLVVNEDSPQVVLDAEATAQTVVEPHQDSYVAPEEPEQQETTEEPVNGGYEAMTKDALVEELKNRGLPSSGNKPELIERLLADDSEPEEQG